MKKNVVVFILSCCFVSTYAQDQIQDEAFSKFNLGFGIGLDYGGFGTRLEAVPAKNIGLFAGLGYNLDGLGYNVGASVKLSPNTRVCPSLVAMYGYNAVLIIVDAKEYNKTYYGPTFGVEVAIKSKRNQNFVNLGLLLPIRDSEFQDDVDSLKSLGVEMTEPLPIAISIAYHFAF